MINHTGQYAMRAVVFLAQHQEEWPIAGARIASETKVPAKYLSSILRTLVRNGLLEANPGPNGGFRMVQAPDQVRLIDVLTPFDGSLSEFEMCPFGNDSCNEVSPCLGHARWKRVKEAYLWFLEQTTVQDVSTADTAEVLGVPKGR